MKIVNFRIGNRKTFGLIADGGIVDLGLRMRPQFHEIRDIITPEGLKYVATYEDAAPDYTLSEIKFLPVIDTPSKIFCIGMNYADKRAEFSESNPAPTLFVRFPHSQTGHCCPVVKPAVTSEFDYEGELAVIIGNYGYQVPARDAYSIVAGYSCYMDGSVRDWQHSWFTAGKNWKQTGAFGPWLVTADEIADPHALALGTWLNGRRVQDDNTGNMIHRIPELIEYISSFSPLEPGDVIITGSPGGVGKKRTPPLFLKDGDLIEVEIEGIGRLENVVCASREQSAGVAAE